MNSYFLIRMYEFVGHRVVSSSLGNGTVAGSYRYDSWQLQFWDTFLCFESSIDIVLSGQPI
jgi:hypothetical protein